MTRQLLRTSYSCTSRPGLWTIKVVYGFCSQMAGTPRGMQFTDDFDSSSSVGVIALIFASAHAWNTGLSSGVTLGSNVPVRGRVDAKAAADTLAGAIGEPVARTNPGWPSGSRGGGPAGRQGLDRVFAVFGASERRRAGKHA